MLLQITYHDKATQTKTEEEDTIEKILKAITTLCIKVDSMDNEIQKLKTNEDNLKSKASQQHDYKNAELRRAEDGKKPELKGDDGKLLKTHNVSSRDFSVRSGFDAEVIGLWKGSVIRHGILSETRSLCGDYDGTRVILVRVMGYVVSAIYRAYEIVHIIFGRRLKCFGLLSPKNEDSPTDSAELKIGNRSKRDLDAENLNLHHEKM
ncbi:hypothetical protein MTR67_025570 [Solanum verrucosum]|uniref:Uncharacterized protein n=1 Tax=Solanum verrucosum TaxID=315347 RepID=A0AAF0TYV6_SOLVR|nr:hypothetical protein MTR67_025570 [Solanum verrucosum]